MKMLRLIMISVCLLVAIAVTAQRIDTVEIYYDYELTPTGRVSMSTDTAYNVVLVMDSSDVRRYIGLTLEFDDVKTDLSVQSSELLANPRIVIQKEKLRMDMEEWTGGVAFNVTAEKFDGSRVMLQPRPMAEAIVHRVLTLKQKTRDLTFYEGEPIIEPVPYVEPDPVQPDTTLNRKTQL